MEGRSVLEYESTNITNFQRGKNQYFCITYTVHICLFAQINTLPPSLLLYAKELHSPGSLALALGEVPPIREAIAEPWGIREKAWYFSPFYIFPAVLPIVSQPLVSWSDSGPCTLCGFSSCHTAPMPQLWWHCIFPLSLLILKMAMVFLLLFISRLLCHTLLSFYFQLKCVYKLLVLKFSI